MKRFSMIAIAMSFAACASSPKPEPKAPARYATEDEKERLRRQALENFQRLKEQHEGQRAMLASVASGPVERNRSESAAPDSTGAQPSSPSRRLSMAEARYALSIGKKPMDLTAGERAAARAE